MNKHYRNKKISNERFSVGFRKTKIKKVDNFKIQPNVNHRKFKLKKDFPELWNAFYVEKLVDEPTDFKYRFLTRLHLKKRLNSDLIKKRKQLIETTKLQMAGRLFEKKTLDDFVEYITLYVSNEEIQNFVNENS